MITIKAIEIDIEKFIKGTESDAEKFAVAFARCFKKAPSVIQTVDNFIGEVSPIIIAVVGIVDPVADPEVAGALAIVETGVGALQASATAAVTGTSLLANLQNFADTVPALLSGLCVKNPVLQKAIEKIVNLVNGEAKVLIPAVKAWVAQIAARAPVAVAA